MQTRRLRTLEKQAAHLPRSLEQLMREVDAMPLTAQRAWLTTLSEAELKCLTAEYAAAGLPDYDWSKLSAAEIDRILDGDFAPLETCPFVTADIKTEARVWTHKTD